MSKTYNVAVLVGSLRKASINRKLALALADLAPQNLKLQIVEIGERTEARIDAREVGNVIAEILHGRAEERRDPDRVHAEFRHIVELLADASEVADTVAVGVEEAARIDLIDGGTAPPFGASRARRDTDHRTAAR